MNHERIVGDLGGHLQGDPGLAARHAVLDRVLDQRLKNEARDKGAPQPVRAVHDDGQPVAKAFGFDFEIGFDRAQFLFQPDFGGGIGRQGRSQEVRQAREHGFGLVVSARHDCGAHGVQRVEQEVRIQLVAQGGETRGARRRLRLGGLEFGVSQIGLPFRDAAIGVQKQDHAGKQREHPREEDGVAEPAQHQGFGPHLGRDAHQAQQDHRHAVHQPQGQGGGDHRDPNPHYARPRIRSPQQMQNLEDDEAKQPTADDDDRRLGEPPDGHVPRGHGGRKNERRVNRPDHCGDEHGLTARIGREFHVGTVGHLFRHAYSLGRRDQNSKTAEYSPSSTVMLAVRPFRSKTNLVLISRPGSTIGGGDPNSSGRPGRALRPCPLSVTRPLPSSCRTLTRSVCISRRVLSFRSVR
ncbi:hypothetical protein D3C80_1112090 [compost metagenome]